MLPVTREGPLRGTSGCVGAPCSRLALPGPASLPTRAGARPLPWWGEGSRPGPAGPQLRHAAGLGLGPCGLNGKGQEAQGRTWAPGGDGRGDGQEVPGALSLHGPAEPRVGASPLRVNGWTRRTSGPPGRGEPEPVSPSVLHTSRTRRTHLHHCSVSP